MAWTSGYTQPKGWKATRLRVLRRDNHTCYICGQQGADQVDHVVSVANGGSHDDANLKAVHASPCHKRKTAYERSSGRRVQAKKTRTPEIHPSLR